MADPTATQMTPLFGVPVAPQATPAAAPVAAPTTPIKKHSDLDNVLGFLGDFLLSRLHMGTPYHDARQNEKINQARLLDAQDPSQTYANLGNLDPTLAAKLQGQATDDKRLAASQASIEEIRAARIAAQKEALRKEVLSRAANYFNNLASDPNDVESRYANGRQLWQNSATVKADPELLQTLNDMYPEKYDPNMITSSIAASVPVSTQWQQRLTKEKMQQQADQFDTTTGLKKAAQAETVVHHRKTEAIGQQNADNGTIRANRPPAPRNPPAPRTPKPTAADLQRLRANPALRDKFDGHFGVGMAKRVLGN